MKKTICIFCFVTAISCGQSTQKKEVIKPTKVEAIAEIPYHQFVDIMLARLDSTEVNTYLVDVASGSNDLGSDKEDFLKIEGLSISEKKMLRQVIQHPKSFSWQHDKLSQKSQRILDNSLKETKESITLRFTDIAIDKGRTKVCILVYTEYGHKDHEFIKGGGMDFVFFSKKQDNTWYIEKLISAVKY